MLKTTWIVIIALIFGSPLLISCMFHTTEQGGLLKHIEALDSKDYDTRYHAVESIGQIAWYQEIKEYDVILTKLKSILEQPVDFELKDAVIDTIAYIGRIPDLERHKLSKGFNSDDPQLRKDAEMELYNKYPAAREAVIILADLLNDGSYVVRNAALIQLIGMGHAARGAIPKIVEFLNDDNSEMRVAALNYLGSIDELTDENVLKALEIIRNDISTVRLFYCNVLISIGPQPDIVDELVIILKEKDHELRKSALLTISGYGMNAVKAVPTIVELLNDDILLSSPGGHAVRTACLTALGSLGRYDDHAVQTLIDILLNNENQEARWEAAYYLMPTGPKPGVIDALSSALEDESAKVRNMAIQTLGYMGKAAIYVIPKLQEIADAERDAGVQANIARTIQKISADNHDSNDSD